MDPLTGYHDRKIDGKDRVVVPAVYAQAIQAESGGRLYLVPGATSPCVEAYPASEFARRAEGHNPDRFEGDPQASRAFYHLAERVELKGPGRITLLKRFKRYFPAREVRVAGMNTYLELWHPAWWEEHVGGGEDGPFPLPGDPKRGPR